MSGKAKGIIAGTIACIIFGVTVIWTKESLFAFSPVVSSVGRISVAAITLTLYGLFTGKIKKIDPKDWKLFVMGGFFNPFIYFIVLNEGIERVDAILSGIIVGTIPLFSPIAAWIFLREKFTPLFFIGMFISFAGVLFAITNGSLHVETSLLGVVFLFLAVITYVLYSVIVKMLSKSYDSFTIVYYTVLAGSFLLVASFFLFEFEGFKPKGDMFTSVMAIIYLGVLGSFLAYILFAYSIKLLGVGRGMVLFNIIPIASTIAAIFFLGEHLTAYKLLGMVLVVGGLYLSLRRSKKHRLHV